MADHPQRYRVTATVSTPDYEPELLDEIRVGRTHLEFVGRVIGIKKLRDGTVLVDVETSDPLLAEPLWRA